MFPNIDLLMSSIDVSTVISVVQAADLPSDDQFVDEVSKDDFIHLCCSFVMNGPVGLGKRIRVPGKSYDRSVRGCFSTPEVIKKSAVVTLCDKIARMILEKNLEDDSPYHKRFGNFYPLKIRDDIPSNEPGDDAIQQRT